MHELAAAGGVLLALVVAGLGVPLPEDLTLLGAGYLAWRGAAPIWMLWVAGFVGIVFGDSMMYWLGRKFGLRVIRHPILAHHITPARLSRLSHFFDRHGEKSILLGRLAAGARGAFFLTAGLLHMPYPRFLLYDGLAACVSASAWIFVGHHFGDHIDHVRLVVKHVEHWIALGVVAVAIAWLLSRVIRRRFMGPAEPAEPA